MSIHHLIWDPTLSLCQGPEGPEAPERIQEAESVFFRSLDKFEEPNALSPLTEGSDCDQTLVCNPGQSFGESICQIVRCIDAPVHDKPFFHFLPHEVVFDVDVLGLAVYACRRTDRNPVRHQHHQ